VEHRNHLCRNALLFRPGDDARLDGADGLARGALSVRPVHGGGGVVRPVAGAASRGVRGGAAGQAGGDVRRCADGGAALAVGGLGFCDPRSWSSLLQTQSPLPTSTARWLDAGAITPINWAQVKLRADSAS